MTLRFKDGMKMRVRCYRCGCDVDSTIYQKRVRWIAELSCPHGMKVLGLVAPMEELVRKGMISTDKMDQAKIADSRKRAHEEWTRDIQERMDWYKSKLS